MKRLVSWNAFLALAVGLAVCTVAQAAVVDVTLTFDKTTLAVGEEVGFTMTIEATSNEYDMSVYNLGTLSPGVQGASVWIKSDQAGVAEIPEGSGFGGVPSGAPDPAYLNYNTASEPVGFGPFPTSYNPQYDVNRGLQGVVLSGTLVSGNAAASGWKSDWSDLEPFMYRGAAGDAVTYMTGTVTALAEGTVTYTPFINAVGDNYNLLIYTVDNTNASTSQRNASVSSDTVNFIGQTLTVGDVVENATPTVNITSGNVLEEDWSRIPAIYNDPAHSVTVTAVGDDADGDPLTYEWTMIKPGGGSKVLGESGAVLNLTIGEIASLGLPEWGVDSNDWFLSVTANDGTASSDPAQINVFVPEPTTIGLLGFGIVALLKRRRRA